MSAGRLFGLDETKKLKIWVLQPSGLRLSPLFDRGKIIEAADHKTSVLTGLNPCTQENITQKFYGYPDTNLSQNSIVPPRDLMLFGDGIMALRVSATTCNRGGCAKSRFSQSKPIPGGTIGSASETLRGVVGIPTNTGFWFGVCFLAFGLHVFDK